MPFTPNGVWYPSLTAKQLEIFNAYERFILVSGPRKSAKTIGVQHRVMRHAWELPSARVGVFCDTLKNAKVGAWDSLYATIAAEWASSMPGFQITKPMSTDATTRMNYFRISNIHGGQSEFQLHSLDNEAEIEAKMKGTMFSCIWVSELTNFRTDRAFKVLKEQLRMPHLKYDQHFWIADTNPCEEEGDQFWAHNIWYVERNQPDHPFPRYQHQLRLIECTIPDNTFLDPREVEDLKASYRNDPDLYAVYIEGKWIQTSKDSFFAGIFSLQRHVVGAMEDEEMEPEADCSTLYTGWDPGDSHSAVYIMEKVERAHRTYWKILDEIVILNGTVSLEDLSMEVLERMGQWEARCKNPIRWVHWSDISAVERYRSSSGTWDQMIIYEATGGRIRIEGVPKFSGSVRLRVQVMKQLLMENRIFISFDCPFLIASLRGGLRKGKKLSEYVKLNDHKHPFDAVTYPILAESSWDLQLSDRPETSRLPGFSTS